MVQYGVVEEHRCNNEIKGRVKIVIIHFYYTLVNMIYLLRIQHY